MRPLPQPRLGEAWSANCRLGTVDQTTVERVQAMVGLFIDR